MTKKHFLELIKIAPDDAVIFVSEDYIWQSDILDVSLEIETGIMNIYIEISAK